MLGGLTNKIMAQEDKQLLLKDLCARLPYDVVIHTKEKDIKLDRNHRDIGVLYYEHYSEEAKKNCNYDENDYSIIISGCYYGNDIKPYLRPLSNMTEEEKETYYELSTINCDVDGELVVVPTICALEFFLSHHLDFNGLIDKGLALEAPEGMYKFE